MVVGSGYYDNSGVRNCKLNNNLSCHLTQPIKLIPSFHTTTKVTGIRSISNHIKLPITESQIATPGLAVHKLITKRNINMFYFISRLKFHLWVPMAIWVPFWRIDRQPSDVITIKPYNVNCSYAITENPSGKKSTFNLPKKPQHSNTANNKTS